MVQEQISMEEKAGTCKIFIRIVVDTVVLVLR
jgi:hypothetical protein